MLKPSPSIDTTLLTDLVSQSMPFGKYKGRLIADLPEPYLRWFARAGFPAGRLGQLLQLAMVIKENDLENLLLPLRHKR